MIKSKKEVVQSIREVTKRARGREFKLFFAYIGTDPITAKRIELARADRGALLDELDRYYATMRAGVAPGDVSRALSVRELADLNAARDALGDLATVPEAASVYAQARAVLDEAGLRETSIVDAVRAFAEGESGVRQISLADALDAYIARLNPSQVAYRRTIQARVGRAVMELGADRTVSSISPTEAMEWLERAMANESETTFNGYLGDLKSFFNWCAKPVRAFCKSNPLASAEKRSVAYKRPEFMSPEETQRWLDILLDAACDTKSKALLWRTALGFFTGARTAEIQRLKWKDLDLEGRTMFVAEVKGAQHGSPPRFVQLNDSAMDWLTARPLERGAPEEDIFPSRDDTRSISNTLDRIARKHGLKIPRNAARHTFVTMHVAAYHDAARTESIVGTSSTMRNGHYQSPVKEADGLRYFNEVRPRG